MKRFLLLFLALPVFADVPVPPAATQAQVNAGTATFPYVSPATLAGATSLPAPAGVVTTPSRVLYVSTNGNDAAARANSISNSYTFYGALNNASNIGDVVFLFPGNYYPTGGVSLANGVTLRGFSRDSVTLFQTNFSIGSSPSFVTPMDNSAIKHLTWNGGSGFESFLLAQGGFTNFLLDDVVLDGGFDVFYGHNNNITNPPPQILTIKNSVIRSLWDIGMVNSQNGQMVSINNIWISQTNGGNHFARIIFTREFPFVDYGSSWYNFGANAFGGGWASGLILNGSKFYGTPSGVFPTVFTSAGTMCSGTYLDVDRNIPYNINAGTPVYNTTIGGCSYYKLVTFGFTSPDTGANGTNTLSWASSDILHGQAYATPAGQSPVEAVWTNNNSSYSVTMNDPVDIELSGGAVPVWSIDDGNGNRSLYSRNGVVAFVSGYPLTTNSDWSANIGAGNPGSSYFQTNIIPSNLATVTYPSIMGNSIVSDWTGTNVTFTGNGFLVLSNAFSLNLITNGMPNFSSMICSSNGPIVVVTRSNNIGYVNYLNTPESLIP